MDFNDFRLFVMPESLHPSQLPSMESMERGNPESGFQELSLTEDPELDRSAIGPGLGPSRLAPGVESDDWPETWSRVRLLDDGDVDTDSLAPANVPSQDENRMSKSLDLGYEEVDIPSASEMANSYSVPWQYRARTLESPRHGHVASETHRQSSASSADSDKIKYKLLSAWNNMKFGMKPKTNFRVDSPIWLLGHCYHCTKREREESERRVSEGGKPLNTAFENFRKDFISRLWFTYRQDFPKLDNSQLNTDVGWGCMLRTGQMMLAQALMLHLLGRDWRWHSGQRKQDTFFHRQIIKAFGDLPDIDCPFSIHRLVQIGAESGKKPGDWYGPASVAFVLREAVERVPKPCPLLGNLCLYIAHDCTVYKQDVIDLCTQRSNERRSSSRSSSTSSSQSQAGLSSFDKFWRPVIILIPVRLGGEAFNPIYTPCVSNVLTSDMCIGIIGGRPKHSLYFIGWQEDKLINLDPHLCQDVVDVRDRNFPLQTYHCMSPRKMSFNKMDPSCTIGFYCKTKTDFVRFMHEAEDMASPPEDKGMYPMFVFQEGRREDLMKQDSPAEERYLRVRRIDRKGRPKGKVKEADDFVFL